MIIRAALLGFIVWFIATIVFRFYGQQFFYPGAGPWLLAATPVVMVALTWLGLRLLRVRPGDQAEAAIGLALPGMLLDAFALHEFMTVFPNLDPTLDSVFGAMLLVAYASVVFSGLLFTRLAPEDERL